MMEVKFLLICCLLGLSNADVRDAIGGVGVKVNYGGIHSPLSRGAGFQIHGAVTGTSGQDSGTSSDGFTQNSQSSGRESGGGNNVRFHARIGGTSLNGGGAISTHDVSTLSGQGRETGNFGGSIHLTGSVKPSTTGGAVRDERIQDLIGTLPCCGEEKKVAPQSGGVVGTQEQSSVNAGGHSTGYANLIGNLGSSNVGSNLGGRAEVSGGSHSMETSGNVDNNTGRSGFHNLIGTLDYNNPGNNAGGHSAGFANLIGTIPPSSTGGNTGHSAGFGNLIGTLTPTNTGGVSHRYSSELSGFQSTGNVGGMTTGHSVGFGNLIGITKPGEISSNFGHAVEFGNLPNNAGNTGLGAARGFSKMETPMTLVQGGNFAGLKPETQPALSVSHTPTHAVNHAGFSTLEYKVPESAQRQTFEHQVNVPSVNTYSGNNRPSVSSHGQIGTFPAITPGGVSTLEYKVPESAQRQTFEHQVNVPAVNTFSGNNRPSFSSHGQIGTFPAITMVDVVKSIEVPNVQGAQVLGVSEIHKNIPSVGRAQSHTLGVMPVRYNTPSLQTYYQTPSVQPAPQQSNFNGYQGSVSTGSAGSYTAPLIGQHRSYQRPTSFGYSGGHYNVHGTHSSSQASSHAGHDDEEFQGY